MLKYYTPKEVAQELRVTERTIYQWLSTGQLQGLRAGTRWRILPDEVDAFVKRSSRDRDGVTEALKTDDAAHAARVDALVGKYADVPFSTDELRRERSMEREREERRWKSREE